MAPGQPCLPNLLIIGAAKAGTTSLHSYLSEHPEIFMSKHKELSYFDGKQWSRGIEWYKSNFDSSYAVNGESSPRYTLYPKLEGVPERIRQVLGMPKMIYTIRDPIDQILSLYTQNVEHWSDTPLLNVADAGFPQTEYMLYSKYYMQLGRYLEFFPRELIHIVIMERLKSNPKAELRKLFRFIGVDEKFWSSKFDVRLNVGAKKRETAPWFRRTAPLFLQEELGAGRWLPWRLNQVLDRLSRVGGEPVQKPTLTTDDECRLQDLLKSDVGALRSLLGDPLVEWRPYA
jgi:hypothetical protein